MKEEHKKKLCELTGIHYCKDENGNFSYIPSDITELEILIKAKWKIQEDYVKAKTQWYIAEYNNHYSVSKNGKHIKDFMFGSDRQKALEAALIYIFEQEK